MTVDDLIAVFEKARAEAAPFPQHHEDGLYAGIAAVVRALRDELSMSKDINSCSACDANYDLFHEILGDAVEKVAGGSTREDEQSCNSSDGSSPTTDHIVDTNKMVPDPAPAVCEWTSRGRNEPGFYSTPHGIRHMSLRHDSCVSCGKPIAFKDAK